MIDSFTVRKGAAYSGPAIIAVAFVKCHAATAFFSTAKGREKDKKTLIQVSDQGNVMKDKQKEAVKEGKERRKYRLFVDYDMIYQDLNSPEQ